MTFVTVTEVKETEGAPIVPSPSYTVEYFYDALGRRNRVSQGGQDKEWHYDSHGRSRRNTFSTLGVEQKTRYDLAGNTVQAEELISNSPAKWKVTKIKTDHLGRVLSTTTPNPADETQEVTRFFIRDSWGQGRVECETLPEVVQPYDALCSDFSDRYQYLYDLMGRNTSVIDPNGTVRTMTYDDEKGVLNEINIVPAQDIMGTVKIVYEYAGSGVCGCAEGTIPTKITTYENTNGVPVLKTAVEREYDAIGNMTKDTLSINGSPYTMEYFYSYGASPYHEIMTYHDGKQITRIYDANQRITELHSNAYNPNPELLVRYRYQGVDKIAEREHLWHGSSKLLNIAAYDSGGFGNQMENRWQRWDSDSWSPIKNWDSTPDPANRIETKQFGSGDQQRNYTFQHDLSGKLTSTVHLSPDYLGAVIQKEDWRRTQYYWDAQGNAKGSTQCFISGSGSEVCEGPSGSPAYALVRNERGVVTSVAGIHVLSYWDGNLQNIARYVGPQTRQSDFNGNVKTIGVTREILDNPDTLCIDSPGPPCDGVDLQEEQRFVYSWSFNYDGWDRLSRASKEVTHTDWQQDACCGVNAVTFPPTVSVFEFTYDGLGRRVASTTSGGAFVNLYDKDGRMAERVNLLSPGNDIRYLHGPGRMPAMMNPDPKVFMIDVAGNLGLLYNCDTDEEDDDTATDDCGQQNKPVSQLDYAANNAYESTYGYSEDGFKLVDDLNWSPWVITTGGTLYCTETKEDKGYKRKEEEDEKKKGGVGCELQPNSASVQALDPLGNGEWQKAKSLGVGRTQFEMKIAVTVPTDRQKVLDCCRIAGWFGYLSPDQTPPGIDITEEQRGKPYVIMRDGKKVEPQHGGKGRAISFIRKVSYDDSDRRRGHPGKHVDIFRPRDNLPSGKTNEYLYAAWHEGAGATAIDVEKISGQALDRLGAPYDSDQTAEPHELILPYTFAVIDICNGSSTPSNDPKNITGKVVHVVHGEYRLKGFAKKPSSFNSRAPIFNYKPVPDKPAKK